MVEVVILEQYSLMSTYACCRSATFFVPFRTCMFGRLGTIALSGVCLFLKHLHGGFDIQTSIIRCICKAIEI